MDTGGVSVGGDLPLFFWRVRGHGADWPGPVPTALVGMQRRPTQIVPVAEPVSAASVDVNRESTGAAAVSPAPVNPSRPGAVAARSVAAGRPPSVGANRSQPPAAVEAGGARPALGDPTYVALPSQPGAEVFVRAPDAPEPSGRSVADPPEPNAPLLSRVGDIVSRQPQATTSEPVTPPPVPEPLPLSVRPVVAPRSDAVERSIARSAEDVAKPRQAAAARDAAQPVVRAREHAATPASLQRASTDPGRRGESDAHVARAIPVSSHSSMAPVQAPLHSPAPLPAASVPLSRGVTPVSDPAAPPTIPLVVSRRSVELPSSSSAAARGVPSAPPLVSRALSPVVTAVRIDEAPTATPVPTVMPASRGTMALRRGDEPGELPRGSAQPTDRPDRAESPRISRAVVEGSATTVTGTEHPVSRGDSTDVDLRRRCRWLRCGSTRPDLQPPPVRRMSRSTGASVGRPPRVVPPVRTPPASTSPRSREPLDRCPAPAEWIRCCRPAARARARNRRTSI